MVEVAVVVDTEDTVLVVCIGVDGIFPGVAVNIINFFTLSVPCDYKITKYVHNRVSFRSKDCTKELKLECAYFLGQTS